LGLQFLKHVSRTTVIAFIIDCSQEGVRETYHVLEEELASYDPGLAERERVIVASKKDLTENRDSVAALADVSGREVIPVSIYDPAALDRLAEVFFQTVLRNRSAS
jgi:GTP-binding protein